MTQINLKERTKNTVKNSAIGLVAQLFQVLSSFGCRMIFVRCLAEAYLGINGLFSNILSILSLGELGIGSAITYELYGALASNDVEDTKSLMAFYKKAYTWVGIAIGVFGLCLFPFIHSLVKLDATVTESVYLLYGLYLINTVVTYFFSYKSSIIDAAQQNYVLTLIHTAVTIVQNITQCVVLLLTKNFVLYLIIQVVCSIGYYVFAACFADKMFPFLKDRDVRPLSKERKERMFVNIKDIFITTVASKLVNSTDNIIITAFGGLVSTGLNSNYALLSATLITFTERIKTGIRASVGNISAIESRDRKVQLFDDIQFLFFWLYFWCGLCFILLVQDVIPLAFGEKYLMPFSVAFVTGLNFYTYQQGTVVNIFKETMGFFSKGKYTSVATGILNIFFSIVLGRMWGVFGILLATFISMMLTTRWYFPFIVFKDGFGISPLHYFKKDLRYWAEAVIIYLITWKICTLVNLTDIAALLVHGVICLCVPNLLIILFHLKDPVFLNNRTRIRSIFGKLLKRKPK